MAQRTYQDILRDIRERSSPVPGNGELVAFASGVCEALRADLDGLCISPGDMRDIGELIEAKAAESVSFGGVCTVLPGVVAPAGFTRLADIVMDSPRSRFTVEAIYTSGEIVFYYRIE